MGKKVEGREMSEESRLWFRLAGSDAPYKLERPLQLQCRTNLENVSSENDAFFPRCNAKFGTRHGSPFLQHGATFFLVFSLAVPTEHKAAMRPKE